MSDALPPDDALAEARALHLSLVLAHQHLGQLSRSTFEAIDGLLEEDAAPDQ